MAPRPQARAGAILLLGVAVAFCGFNASPFVPPPLEASVVQVPAANAEARNPGLDGLEYLQRSVVADVGLMKIKALQDIDTVVRAFEEASDEANSECTVPVPISGVLQAPEPTLLEKVLKPLTKFFMKLIEKPKPRCEDCRMWVREGFIIRRCKKGRHNARQPYFSMNPMKYLRIHYRQVNVGRR
mmetsp:Transcript_102941/g.295403  ORF Transcript_102941/g.295403 Transcript_102941/m.295403 type:complete len:185 (-) Transcript_102941:138-692(-)